VPLTWIGGPSATVSGFRADDVTGFVLYSFLGLWRAVGFSRWVFVAVIPVEAVAHGSGRRDRSIARPGGQVGGQPDTCDGGRSKGGAGGRSTAARVRLAPFTKPIEFVFSQPFGLTLPKR